MLSIHTNLLGPIEKFRCDKSLENLELERLEMFTYASAVLHWFHLFYFTNSEQQYFDFYAIIHLSLHLPGGQYSVLYILPIKHGAKYIKMKCHQA